MNISLKQFLQTGVLGRIGLGPLTPETAALLSSGITQESPSREGARCIRFYGDFHFDLEQEGGQIVACTAITWIPSPSGLQMPGSWRLEDWEISASTTPTELRKYLRHAGIKFRSQSSTHYYVKHRPHAHSSPEMAKAAETLGFLSFKKPKDPADIVSMNGSVMFSLASGVMAYFKEERLTNVLITSVLLRSNEGEAEEKESGL